MGHNKYFELFLYPTQKPVKGIAQLPCCCVPTIGLCLTLAEKVFHMPDAIR